MISTITFDFGNTLVPVDRASLGRVVERTAAVVGPRLGPFPDGRFLEVWAEERERQFREEVPRFREVDLAERFVRVLARLRDMAAPAVVESWDQPLAATLSDPAEVTWAVEAYSHAFVESIPAPAAVAGMLRRLASRYTLGILSNWPLAATIDHYAAEAGWAESLRAIVVSQRVGTIKPDRRIFDAALEALGEPVAQRALHVGDDWLADVVGAVRAGWHAAYVSRRPEDSPLPMSEPDAHVTPAFEVASVAELEAALAAGETDAAGEGTLNVATAADQTAPH